MIQSHVLLRKTSVHKRNFRGAKGDFEEATESIHSRAAKPYLTLRER